MTKEKPLCPRCKEKMIEKRRQVSCPDRPKEVGDGIYLECLVLHYEYYWYCKSCECKYQVEIEE